MVQITRKEVGGLGIGITGGAEHKLPIFISKIYKDQAAEACGQLYVGDAIIKVNGEYITACPHDDAVNILSNAGDFVVLTVKHYKAAGPFLQKQCKLHLIFNAHLNKCLVKIFFIVSRDADNDATCIKLKAEGFQSSINSSRPASICSEPSERKWVDIVSGK